MKEIQIVSLILIGMLAVLADLYWGKIPNGLIAAGLVCGLFYQLFVNQVLGILLFSGGILLPGLVLCALYYYRMIGAGDIKLFCVIGGFTGPGACMGCMVLSLLFGGIISLIIMIRRHSLGRRLSYLGMYISSCLEGDEWKSYLEGTEEQARFCFSVPVLVGLLCYAGGIF